MKRRPGLACAIFLAAISLANLAPAAGQTASVELAAPKTMMAELSGVNAAIRSAGAKWTAADNPILRLTPAQKKRRLGLKKQSLGALGSVMSLGLGTAASLPATLDWRNYNGKNYVTAVKDQGDCGSCWAFSTTGGLESYVLRTQNIPGQNENLSEQIVLSCSGAGNCEMGGIPSAAANFMKSTGVGAESAYPYTQDDGACSNAAAGWQKDAERIGKWSTITGATPALAALKQALLTYGPLPTTMQVYDDFFSYTSGVYSYTSGSLEGGHAVLIVGYDDANQCFIVKNSWDTIWGENGYFRIAYSQLSSGVNFGADTIAYSSAAPTALSVAITSPANNATVSGTITISGTASETATNVVVRRVQVQAGSGDFLPASGTTKWSYSLNTTQLGNGKHTITVHAFNSTGSMVSAAVTITVTSDPPAIISPASATVALGAAFRYAITATNSPTSFNATGLPAGLSVDTKAGVISGAVAKAGSYNATISAANAKGTASKTLAIYVGPPVITSAASATGVIGTAFSYAITAVNMPISFSAAGLPAGLSINAQTGAIGGYPTASGNFRVILGATSPAGTGTLTLALAIGLPPMPVITSAANASGVVNKVFNYSITATNNPTRFDATGLPAGLSINPYIGAISGYLLTGGTFTVRLSASNPGGAATKALTLFAAVLSTPVITSAASASGKVGAAFSYAITASNSPTSFTAAGLPAGLSLNKTTGAISGKPTKAGTYSASLSAANIGGAGTQTLVITIK